MTRCHTTVRHSLSVAAVPAGLVLLAVALRSWGAGVESYWLDEAYAVTIARLPVSGTVAETARDVHPPLYYLLLHYWLILAGASEAATRLLSLVCSVATLVLVWRWSARVFDRTTAGIAAALLAVSPFQVEFAQEARMYALLALLGSASMASYWAFTQRPTVPHLAAYVAATTLALYCHVHAVFLVAAQWVAVWFIAPSGDRRALLMRWWPASQALTLLLFAPWLPTLVAQATRVREGFWIPPLPWFAPAWPVLTFAGSPVLAWLLGPLALLGIVDVWKGRPAHAGDRADVSAPLVQRRLAILMLAWFAVPIALPLILSLTSSPIFLPKYLIAASIPFAILAGRGLVRIPGHTRQAATMAIIVLLSIAQVSANVERRQKDGWREAVAAIEATAAPGDVVVVHPSFNRIPFEFYQRRADIVVRTIASPATAPDKLCAELETLAGGAGHLWIVGLATATGDVAMEAAAALAFVQTAEMLVHGVRVSRFVHSKGHASLHSGLQSARHEYGPTLSADSRAFERP